MTEHQITKVELEEAIAEGRVDGVSAAEMDCRALESGKTSIQDSEFRNVHFGTASLSEVSIQRALFSGAVLRGVRGPRVQHAARYEDSDMAESQFINAHLNDVEIEGCNLANGNLSMSALLRCIFKNTDMMRINLSGTSWIGGKAEDTRLGGANLASAQLAETLLCDVSLRGANLCGANLSHSIWLGVDLTGAELSRAQMDGALWIGCRMDGIQWGDSAERPVVGIKSLSTALSEFPQGTLTALVLYLLEKAGTLLHGESLRPSGTALPVPDAYQTASFREILSTLQMSLPHPEWMTLTKDSGEDHTPRSPKAESPPVPPSGTSEEKVVSSPEEPSEGDGRFSLLEID